MSGTDEVVLRQPFGPTIVGDYCHAVMLESGKHIEDVSALRATLGMVSWRRIPVLAIRVSQALSGAHVPLLPKLIAFGLFVCYGVEFAQRASIGPGLYLPHPQGTVLGAAVIGRRAVIFQQVTLGAKFFDNKFDVNLRPVLGDDVTVGAGAKILGHVRVGNKCTVGANAVVLDDVPSNATVVGSPSRVIERGV